MARKGSLIERASERARQREGGDGGMGEIYHESSSKWGSRGEREEAEAEEEEGFDVNKQGTGET